MHRIPILLCSGFASLQRDALPIALQALVTKASKPLVWGPDVAWTTAAHKDTSWIWQARGHETGDKPCCTADTGLRAKLEQVLAQHQPDLVVLLTETYEATLPLAQALGATPLFPGQEAGFVLQSVIHVVDTDTLTHHLHSPDTLTDHGHHGAHASQSVAEACLANIETSNTILWRGTGENLSRLLPILAPKADVTPYSVDALQEAASRSPFTLAKTMEAPGWLQTLRGHTQTSEYTHLFKSRRPFHPARWKAVADAGWPGLVRLRGFVWLATQMKFKGQWIRAGASWNIAPSGIWWADMPQERWPSVPAIRARIMQHWQEPWGDRIQELALLGQPDTLRGVVEALQQALLTEEEMALGQLGWRYFYDPVHGLTAQGVGQGMMKKPEPDPSLAEAVHSVHFPTSS